ncbi:MAG: hypothetical protein ACI4U3_00240 [Traorella sp.]
MKDKTTFVKNGFRIFTEAISFIGILCIILVLFLHPKSKKVASLLTMEELGYQNTYVEQSLLAIDKSYYLKISDNKINTPNSTSFDIEIKNGDEIDFLESIKNIKQIEKDFTSNCTTCQFYENEGNVLDYVNKLDEKIWNVDQAYTLYDWNHLPEGSWDYNYLFLYQDNKIISISLKSKTKLNDQQIQFFCELFERYENTYQ